MSLRRVLCLAASLSVLHTTINNKIKIYSALFSGLVSVVVRAAAIVDVAVTKAKVSAAAVVALAAHMAVNIGGGCSECAGSSGSGSGSGGQQ